MVNPVARSIEGYIEIDIFSTSLTKVRAKAAGVSDVRKSDYWEEIRLFLLKALTSDIRHGSGNILIT